VQLTLFTPVDHPILDDLRQVDLNLTTPMAGLELLKTWQDRLAAETRRKAEGGRRKS
jgi:hypothetical protein